MVTHIFQPLYFAKFNNSDMSTDQQETDKLTILQPYQYRLIRASTVVVQMCK